MSNIRSGGFTRDEATGALLVTQSGGLTAINVKDYGVVGDGVTDDASGIQAAIDACSAAGGGLVYVPAGTFVIGTTLVMRSKVHLLGTGPPSTSLKLKDRANTDILTVAAYGANGIQNFSIRDLAIDGNAANNSAGSGLVLDGITFLLDNLYIHDCAVDGINEQKSIADGALRAYGEMDAFTSNVKVWDAGRYGIRWDGHDCHFTNVVCISNDTVNFLLDTNAFAAKLVSCHFYGAANYGVQANASGKFVNCESEGARNANVLLNADNVKWIGGEVFADGTGNGLVGFEWAAGKGFNSLIVDVKAKGCTGGAFKFTGTGSNSRVGGIVEQASGTAIAGSPTASVAFDVTVFGGATLGGAGLLQVLRAAAPNDGDQLVADSTVASGAKWQSRGGGVYYGPGTVAGSPVSGVSPAANAYEYHAIVVPNRPVLHGIVFRVGTVAAGNIRVGLYNGSGALLASSASTVLGTATNFQKVPFLVTATVEAGTYFLLIQYSSGVATIERARLLVPSGTVTGADFTAIPASITPPTDPENVDRPVLMTY